MSVKFVRWRAVIRLVASRLPKIQEEEVQIYTEEEVQILGGVEFGAYVGKFDFVVSR